MKRIGYSCTVGLNILLLCATSLAQPSPSEAKEAPPVPSTEPAAGPATETVPDARAPEPAKDEAAAR
ncbi:MAG: hypothetical protein RJA70_1204, partial [Pseudomonadota bacterium]